MSAKLARLTREAQQADEALQLARANLDRVQRERDHAEREWTAIVARAEWERVSTLRVNHPDDHLPVIIATCQTPQVTTCGIRIWTLGIGLVMRAAPPRTHEDFIKNRIHILEARLLTVWKITEHRGRHTYEVLYEAAGATPDSVRLAVMRKFDLRSCHEGT